MVSNQPAISAIVVIPDRYETVQSTMDYLGQQTAAKQMEIVFVAPDSVSFHPYIDHLKIFHSWKVVRAKETSCIATGFTTGIFNATALIVALTEDHSFPEPTWAEHFIRDHEHPWAVVGPSMKNGNPVNLVSWADFYQAYGQWNHPVKSGKVPHLPGHNSCYKSAILVALGEQLGVLMQSESVLHRKLSQQGYDLFLDAEISTSHLNFDTWSAWIPARFFAGKQFAGTWASSWSWLRRAGYAIATPGIPLLRLWRTQKIVRERQKMPYSLKLLMVIFTGYLIEGLGNFLGFIFGVGSASRQIAFYEFHRIKNSR